MMRTWNKITATTILVILLANELVPGRNLLHAKVPATEAAHEWFVFVAADFTKELQQELSLLIGKKTRVDDIVHVIRAPEHECLASVTISEGTEKARWRRCENDLKQVAKLRDATNRGEMDHQLDVPRIAATVNSLRKTKTPVKIILIGDPVFHDTRDQGWSWRGGRVASIGALCLEQSDCPFSQRRSKTQFPQHTEVFWLTHAAQWGANEEHREQVVACYAHFFASRNAWLRQLGTDAAAVFARAATEANESDLKIPNLTTPPNDFVGVWNLSRQSVPVASPQQPSQVPVLLWHARRVITTTPAVESTDEISIPNAVTQAINQVRSGRSIITVIWTTEIEPLHCDIDIYARNPAAHQPDQTEIFYQQPTTNLGKLYRDVVVAGAIDGDGSDCLSWEAVEVSEEDFSKCQFWLNAFRVGGPV